MYKTKISFRKFPDETIIAIFPEEKWGSNMLTSYMHEGQHGGCDPELLQELPAANEEERKELLEELQGLGYVCTC